MSTSEKSLVGQVLLGRYRVLRRLALGGMGAVYLARTEGARGFSKPVVIKRILPIWGRDEEIVSLFAREARILSQLQDPGIVSVMDFGQITDGTLVMVLDYVHGYHLAHWLAYLCATQGQMPVEMALHIMLRVLSALQYAHTFVKPDGKPLAVVHRDVSPGNILLDVSGNVKLVDFGIARAEGDANEYKTEAPQLRGKFGYLAPELFTGVPPSPQSDVYSAGVVLYELLTGGNPFRGRELTDSYHKALHVTAPDLSGLRSDVSVNLKKVIDNALAKNPAQRYASAAEFADALRPERFAPDEVCQARLRAAVQSAFAGPLADALGIEPLSASDEAWREAAEGNVDQSLAIATHEPPQPVTPGHGVARFARSPLPAQTAGDDAAGQPLMAAEQLEEQAEQQRTLVRGSPLPVSSPSRGSTLLRWVSVLSMVLFGALAVAGILRSLEHKEDQVIVIERETNAPTDNLVEPSAAPAHRPALAARDNLLRDAEVHESNGTEGSGSEGNTYTRAAERDTAARAAGAAGAKAARSSAPKPNTPVPVGPEPLLLTSTFAREQPRVQRCFAAHADNSDSLAEITLGFHVGLGGTVETVDMTPARLASSALGTCLLDIAKNTRFPRLTHSVTFRIPIQARVAMP
jgi:serine/threonine protein kinase